MRPSEFMVNGRSGVCVDVVAVDGGVGVDVVCVGDGSVCVDVWMRRGLCTMISGKPRVMEGEVVGVDVDVDGNVGVDEKMGTGGDDGEVNCDDVDGDGFLGVVE